ncbi:MAG: hypothetical protein HFJ40_07355 [Clostridia bacterium]|nr:hypothetical protein [Clostridia bacterium]
MFVYNIKINGSKTFKIIFSCMIILLIFIILMVMLKIFKGASNSENNSTCMPKNNIAKIDSKNYTNILKVVHENIDTYVGKKINFTGYVYRVLDLNENQFVLSRDMVISSDYQSVIVGFLCEYNKAKDFEDNTWVEVTGEITKGDYHGDMPIIKVTDIKKVDKPNEEYVYPPDESYIPTNGIL